MKINFKILSYLFNLFKFKSYPIYFFSIEGKNKEKVSKILDDSKVLYEIYMYDGVKEGYTYKMNGKHVDEKVFNSILSKLKTQKIKYFTK